MYYLYITNFEENDYSQDKYQRTDSLNKLYQIIESFDDSINWTVSNQAINEDEEFYQDLDNELDWEYSIRKNKLINSKNEIE